MIRRWGKESLRVHQAEEKVRSRLVYLKCRWCFPKDLCMFATCFPKTQPTFWKDFNFYILFQDLIFGKSVREIIHQRNMCLVSVCVCVCVFSSVFIVFFCSMHLRLRCDFEVPGNGCWTWWLGNVVETPKDYIFQYCYFFFCLLIEHNVYIYTYYIYIYI